MILVRHGQSEFNAAFGKNRIDPGIEDPSITAFGAEQALISAQLVQSMSISRLISSPYRRALETATIIAELLGAPILIDPLVRERFAFSCDIGTPASQLARDWPELDFSDLDEQWWPVEDETYDLVAKRARQFIEATVRLDDRDRVAVITHWGFIRCLTGLQVTNGAVVRVDRVGRGAVVGTPNS